MVDREEHQERFSLDSQDGAHVEVLYHRPGDGNGDRDQQGRSDVLGQLKGNRSLDTLQPDTMLSQGLRFFT